MVTDQVDARWQHLCNEFHDSLVVTTQQGTVDILLKQKQIIELW